MDRRVKDELPERLARAVDALGTAAAARARSVRPERVAQHVLAELRRPAPAVVVPLWRRPVLRLAAALALLTVTAVGVRMQTGPTAGTTAIRLPMVFGTAFDSIVRQDDTVRQDLAADLLAVVDSAVSTTTPVRVQPTLYELTEEELRALLQAMENTEDVS